MTQEHGEGKAKAKKSTRGDFYYKRYPARFRRDTVHDHQMPFDLRCQWSLIIDLFYEHDGALPNDDQWIAHALFCDVRKWRHIRAQLFAIGKLFIGDDGLVHNKTADAVIEERDDRVAKRTSPQPLRRLGKGLTPASTPASTSPSTSPSTDRGTEAHLSEKPNGINGGTAKTATYARAFQTEEKREEVKQQPFSSNAEVAKKDEPRVTLRDGKIELFNGLRAYWLERFDGDAQGLEDGLLQAANYVQANSSKPLEVQVSAQLARQCANRRDRAKPDEPRMTAAEAQMAKLRKALLAPVMGGAA